MTASNVSGLQLPAAISIREVGPRDGLQNEDPIGLDSKIALLNALSGTGVRRIEAVSFVHPRAIPQMADADAVWQGITRNPEISYSALAPNLTGVRRALDAGFREIEVVISASDTHNKRNINRSTAESLAELAEIVPAAHAAGATVELIIATSFGCPYEGPISVSRVESVVERGAATGIDRVSFGDTIGVATPRHVVELVEAVRARWPLPLLLHFHNTRGAALANVLAAMQLGVTEFDASIGGLGGCPYAPGASGNLATEELVSLAHGCGIATGIDLDALVGVAQLAEGLVGRQLPSGVLRAATPPADAAVAGGAGTESMP